MTYCKQIPLPVLEADIEKIKFFYKNGYKLFSERQIDNPYWKSFNLITNSKISPVSQNLKCITSWLKLIQEHTGIKNIKNCYISVLKPKCAIPWHTDAEGEKFTSSFITSISTDKSFLEVDNIKYTYKNGYSYIFRAGFSHRVLNLNDDLRITLCTTPEENPYRKEK
jgi:hypothetical protein|tara:strand:+ start:2339 stop:2839 length:501 start_codon:yes stop_codon:yes gene_type:complete